MKIQQLPPRKIFMLITAVIAIIVGHSSLGQDTPVINESQKLTASDGEAFDSFGVSVAVSEQTAIIGASNDETFGEFEFTGSAYIFEKDVSTGSWTQTAKILAQNREDFDQFGSAVSLFGKTALVGAPQDGPRQDGFTSFFEKDTDGNWVRIARFSGGNDTQSGDSVTIAGDIAAAGGPYRGEENDQPGAVQVYERDAITGIWALTARLSPSDAASEALRFGDSVSVSNDTILVAAPLDSKEPGLNKGAAYVFEKAASTGDWVEVKKLVPPDSDSVINFPHNVFITDDVAFVCATSSDTADGEATGSVYVFEKSHSTGDWVQTDEFTASNPSERVGFGSSISVSGDIVLVGASSTQTVYVFQKDYSTGKWAEVAKLAPSDDAPAFGVSVSLSGNIALVGESRNGAVYVFDLPLAVGTSLTVNSVNDGVDANPGDGQCETAVSGECTLRAAIQEANALPEADTIILPKGSHTLTLVGADEDDGATGDLDITDHLTIVGPDARRTIINGGKADRVLHIMGSSDSDPVRVKLTGITIQNGDAGSGNGGGVFNSNGSLVVEECIITNNKADSGGGILNTGELSVFSSTISGNSASLGGGLFNQGMKAMAIRGGSISENSATNGAGVYDEGKQTFMTNSTLARNTASGEGGGTVAFNGVESVILNCTISANAGAGVSFVKAGMVTLQNSLVAGNDMPCIGNAVSSATLQSLGNNLIGEPDNSQGCEIVLIETDLTGNSTPGEFTNDGTPGNGHFPLTFTSQAVDAGNNDTCPPVDQLGNSRRNRDGDGDGIVACDIGAIEFPDFLDISRFPVRIENQKLTASDTEPNDSFGNTVSISEDTILAGAHLDFSTTGSRTGTAFVFERDADGNWQETAKLEPSDHDSGVSWFGIDVSVSGNTALVGAERDRSSGLENAGSAYIFEKDVMTGAWTEIIKLTASDAKEFAFFGGSVSISSDIALVGNSPGSFSSRVGGSAYIFEKDLTTGEWVEAMRLTASDDEEGNRFGGSVSISGNTAAIGALGVDDDAKRDIGAVYIFEKVSGSAEWVEVTKLTAPDPKEEDQFGSSLSLSDNTLLVGTQRAGVMYIFEKDSVTGNWRQTAKLGNAKTFLGRRVSLSGDTALTSSSGGSPAFVFERSEDGRWLPTKLLDSSGAEVKVGFSLSGDTAAITDRIEAGTLYVFHLDDAPDDRAPVITLLGDETVTLLPGDKYEDEGATAADDVDGDISEQIVVTGLPIDTAISGTYTIDYNVSDRARNVADTVTRTVIVQRIDPPVILLVGEPEVTLLKGEGYEDLGATAFDDIDGDISDQIVVSGLPVDTSIPGVITITYTVSDLSGNEASKTRTVTVLSHSEAIGDLLSLVDILDLSEAAKASLVAPLEEANEKLTVMDAQSDREATELLTTFIQRVFDLPFGFLDQTDEITLRADARRIQIAIHGTDIIPLTEIQKLVPSEVESFDGFGHRVASFEDIALIGRDRPGSVYVFEKDSTTDEWTETVQLKPSDAEVGNFFGRSIAIFGTTAVIGDVRATNTEGVRTGAVYVFERDSGGNWIETAKLLADDGTDGDAFGNAVAIFENTILVGAVADDVGGKRFRGSAYIFEKDATSLEWIETKKLRGSKIKEFDLEHWGETVALSDNIAVLGAPGGSSLDAGRAAIFEKDPSTGAWRKTVELNPEIFLDSRVRFGSSVAILDETVVVGMNDTLPTAFVFQKNISTGEWMRTAMLTVYDEIGDASGPVIGFDDIIISENTILGSASIVFDIDGESQFLRTVYVFQKDVSTDAWIPVKKLITSRPPSVEENSRFGKSLSIFDGIVFTGDSFDADAGRQVGAAYVFDIGDMDKPVEEMLTFTPAADATIKEDFPTENFGTVKEVITDNRPVQHFLMKFDVSGIGDREVTSAKLRLHCMNKSDKGGDLHETDNDWSEDTITWENAPEPDSNPVVSLGPVARRTWVEVDLTSVVSLDGIYSFRVISPSRDGADYQTKERRGREPELILTVK